MQGAASQPGTQTVSVRATLHHQQQLPQGFPHLLSPGTALQAPRADRSLAGRKALWHLLSVKFKASDAAWQRLFAGGMLWLRAKPSTDIHCQSHSPRDAARTGILPGGITFHFEKTAKMIFSYTENKGLQGDFAKLNPITQPCSPTQEKHLGRGFCSSYLTSQHQSAWEINCHHSAPTHEAGT